MRCLSIFVFQISYNCRSQWPRGLRRTSATARLLRLWVRIEPGAWMFVCCECCVLSGRGLCDELITRPEESYRLLCVVVCDLEDLWLRRPWPIGGCCAKRKERTKEKLFIIYTQIFLKFWGSELKDFPLQSMKTYQEKTYSSTHS